MEKPANALMTVKGGDAAPDLADAADQLGVPAAALNAAFGVVPVDPDNRLYAVEVLPGFTPAKTDAYRGPFSNPPIAPFGPMVPTDQDAKK